MAFTRDGVLHGYMMLPSEANLEDRATLDAAEDLDADVILRVHVDVTGKSATDDQRTALDKGERCARAVDSDTGEVQELPGLIDTYGMNVGLDDLMKRNLGRPSDLYAPGDRRPGGGTTRNRSTP